MKTALQALSLVAFGLSAPLAGANETTMETSALMGSMAKFAQPVRVGDLVGRDLLKPEYQQAVLGHIAPASVVKAADGSLFLVVDWGGILGIGTTRVVVPLDETALLGEHVILVHVPTPKLAALRRFDPAALVALPPDREIRMMIVGPYH